MDDYSTWNSVENRHNLRADVLRALAVCEARQAQEACSNVNVVSGEKSIQWLWVQNDILKITTAENLI